MTTLDTLQTQVNQLFALAADANKNLCLLRELIMNMASATGTNVVDTYAEARALAITPAPNVVYVLGATAPGTGQGIYVWDSESEEPDTNGYACLALTANGTNPGRLIRRFN